MNINKQPQNTQPAEASQDNVILASQPECNIGTIGHVDHGKTTLVQALTGSWAARHSEELKRGITIRLGYADMSIYKCKSCEPPRDYSTRSTCPHCGSESTFIRAISFVDAPGHEALMATMLSGAAIMDGALLVIAADEPCPQPQTREHLAAAEIVGMKNLVIVQNKIDIVDAKRAQESFKEIREFVQGTIAEDVPVIPVSAQRQVNMDVLVHAMEECIPTPTRDEKKSPLMYVVRSFDVNKPGTPVARLAGGVVGGTIVQGEFAVGEEIEMRPGIGIEKDGKRSYSSIFTQITSLRAGGKDVEVAHCGGLVGIATHLDPSFTKADGLTGNVAGRRDELPPTLKELTFETHMLEQAVGTRELVKVQEVKKDETLLLHVGPAITVGTVTSTRSEDTKVRLTRPVCAETGSRVALSRKIVGRWRLIGYGMTK